MTYRLLFLIVLAAGCAYGQITAIKTRILTLATDQELENTFFLNDGKAVPFNANRSGLGDPFEYTGPAQFILRAKPEDFTAKQPLPQPVASVALPLQSKLVLLVGESGPDQKVKLKAYDVSAENFRAGDYMVFNCSEKSVSLIFGDVKFALKPGEDKTVSKAILRDNTLDVVVQIAELKDGVLKRVYSSAWGHQPAKRNFVFLFNGSHPTRPIAIRRFADYVK